RFTTSTITKILTLESSGIASAVMTGLDLGVPVIFSRKRKSLTLNEGLYSVNDSSHTKQETNELSIDKEYIAHDDIVLSIDDILAKGQAALGSVELVQQAGAQLEGVGIVIEKGFQKGGDLLRKRGIRVESLAIISSLDDHQVTFQL